MYNVVVVVVCRTWSSFPSASSPPHPPPTSLSEVQSGSNEPVLTVHEKHRSRSIRSGGGGYDLASFGLREGVSSVLVLYLQLLRKLGNVHFWPGGVGEMEGVDER